MTNAHIGVMLMTYGSPATLDDIPTYLKNVRGGRQADEELITEFRRRYALIGGSPLLRITREQARKYAFDWEDRPLLRVKPGESFEIETYDASTGYFRAPTDQAIPAKRPGFDRVPAVQRGALHEIKSPLILQPGPAALTDGLDGLAAIIARWSARAGDARPATSTSV